LDNLNALRNTDLFLVAQIFYQNFAADVKNAQNLIADSANKRVLRIVVEQKRFTAQNSFVLRIFTFLNANTPQNFIFQNANIPHVFTFQNANQSISPSQNIFGSNSHNCATLPEKINVFLSVFLLRLDKVLIID